MNENRIDNPHNDPQNAAPNKDMTQRVRLEDAGQVTPRPVNPRRDRNKKRWYMTRKEKVTLITLASITAVLLVAAIIMITMILPSQSDDGRILKGVVAAGVNLGGMTQDEAAIALQNATAETYTKLDMVVTVLDTQIALSPKDTGARLDIQAVVKDAYNYGRTGSRAEQNQAKNNALKNSVNIPITSHLNLDTDYIRDEINKLGAQFSSTLSQPSFNLSGTKPQMGVAKPDTLKTHQTLEIYVGTAEYGLDTNKLFNQIMEYYNTNIFQVVGVCTVVAPDSLDDELMSYYEELCVEPIDAQMDPVTFAITPEVYGYGFKLDDVKELLAKTPYGQTVKIPLRYIAPNITEESLSGNLFKDIIGDEFLPLTEDEAWNNNVNIACQALNGLRINSGDTFSFNSILGALTADKGYLEAMTQRGQVSYMVMGGGVAHAASALYICALEAELEILERHSHDYVPDFVELGRDAYVDGSSKDLCFRNNRPDPIQIKAEVVDGELQISLEGTDSRSYTIEIKIKTTKTIRPGKLYNTMLENNPGGYTDGDILVSGANGYVVEIYKSLYDKEDGHLQNENFITTYSYAAQDSIVVKIDTPAQSDPNTDSEF